MATAVRRLAVPFVMFAVVLISSLCPAQSERATLSGRVTDANGAVIVGARVEATNTDMNVSTTTQSNREGLYVIPGLIPGHYRLTVTKEGFKTITKVDIVLHVQDFIAQNIELPVGSVSESVTVSASGVLVDTQSASVGTIVDHQFVENMPLNGRSIQTLIDLTPGTVLTPASFDAPGQFSVNGQRSDANYLTVDGVSANIAASPGGPMLQYGAGTFAGLSAAGGTNTLVSVDALQEFRVQTSTFAPEYGRTPGGQISITTRSGANQFHGTAFEYLRNDVLDATDWFTTRLGLPKPALRQNDFGGVFSGPIVKDRAFFFFSYEGLRLRLPQTKSTVVPSDLTRAAAIPAMVPFVNAFPLPTGPDRGDGLAPAVASYSDPSSLDAVSLRVDYNPTKNWNLFGRYNYAPSSSSRRSADPTIDIALNTIEKLRNTTQTLTFGATTLVNPRLSNEFRFNYSRYKSDAAFLLDDFGGAVPLDPTLAFPSGVTFANGTIDLILFNSPNPILLAAGPIARNTQRQLNFVDSVSWSKGAHLLKFGVDYRHLSPIQNPLEYTQQPIFLDAPSLASGFAFIMNVNSGRGNVNYRFSNWSLFAQDSWKVTPRLTLTYGLRWEINPVPTTGGDTPQPYTFVGLNTDNLDPATLTTLAPAGTLLYETSFHDFAPRVGVAYRVIDSNRWSSVLRGGFGLFYDISSSVYGSAADGFPNRAGNTQFFVAYPATPAQIAPPPLGVQTVPVDSITVVGPSLESPYSWQWNVAYQQQLGKDQSVSATYVGGAARRLIYDRQFSPANANFTTITIYQNGATADYHALQLQFTRNLARGLQGTASYTWAHAIDQDSNAVGLNGLARGNANFDIRHSFSGALYYAPPRPHWGTVPDAILKDWSIDSFFRAASAPPVDLIGSFNVISTEFRQFRPDIVPGEPFYVDDPTAPGGRAINGAAFTPAAPDTQGNLGRNVLRGLGSWQIDLAFQRDFLLTERVKLQFRSELFNIFNHPNFGLPDPRLGSPTFGVPTQTLAQNLGQGGSSGGFNPLYQVGGPRSIQFAFKLQF